MAATEEGKKLKVAFKEPRVKSDQASRSEGADALRRYLSSDEAQRRTLGPKARNSKPALVTLRLDSPYPTTVPFENLPEVVEQNPEYYGLVQKMLAADEED